jgi:hypothetical protein
MEKNCRWHFGNEGGIDIGPNDPIHETFKGNVYYSIVRESIQNSLDAVNNDKEPVKVVFDFFDVSRNEFPNLFEIENHIKQCLTYYNGNDNADRLFNEMLHYLNGEIEGKKRLKLTCMKIADYNTIGMKYDDGNDTKSPFYAFLRAAGVTAKNNQGAGGSFGFGKGAYFALSPIKTLIVSSKDTNGHVCFEGATRLTTHLDTSSNRLTAYGFYDCNDGKPIQDANSIPDSFKRNEVGTDINIIGLWNESSRKDIMVKSVLNNFWLSIYQGNLVVRIDDVTIDKSNLEQVIDRYFDGEYEGAAREIEEWNPKSYFKAVKYANTSDQFKVFQEDLETLGSVVLYVYLDKGLPNRISHFRKPKMVVYKHTNRKINGYSAVFICENSRGNELLRSMENPAHNEWRIDNYPKKQGNTDPIARKAINELSSFVNRSLESLSKIKSGKKITFLGLEEYLSIPEDLLEKDDEFDFEGNSTNNDSGINSNDKSEEETGAQTTIIAELVKIKATAKGKQEVPEQTEIEPAEDGSEKVTVGGENQTSGGNDNPTDAGDTTTMGNRADNGATLSKMLINVKFRTLAQTPNGIVEHILIINADKDINDVELELFVGADNDREDGIAIIESDAGTFTKNTLRSISLKSGRNVIKIRFADNVKHSVKLKAYEYQ